MKRKFLKNLERLKEACFQLGIVQTARQGLKEEKAFLPSLQRRRVDRLYNLKNGLEILVEFQAKNNRFNIPTDLKDIQEEDPSNYTLLKNIWH